jgi:hypothetical protein
MSRFGAGFSSLLKGLLTLINPKVVFVFMYFPAFRKDGCLRLPVMSRGATAKILLRAVLPSKIIKRD